MKAFRTFVSIALAILFLALVPAATAEDTDASPVTGLCLLTADAPVCMDRDLTVFLGILPAGQVVYALEQDASGSMEIVFVYPDIPVEGWVAGTTLVPLEGAALYDHMAAAGDGAVYYRNRPLLPSSFILSGAADGMTVLPEAAQTETAFTAAILRQPEDQKGRVGKTVTFSVEAENVKTYRWQFHNGRVWKDSTMKGCDGPAMEVEVAEKRYDYTYRCILTFEDGTVLFSDEARILR